MIAGPVGTGVHVPQGEWRCEGTRHGRLCNRLLVVFDASQTSIDALKNMLQVKCFRCFYLNGISPEIVVHQQRYFRGY